MKFPGKRAFWWYLVLTLLGIACGFTLYSLILEPGAVTWVSAGMMVAAFLFTLSIQFRNDMELDEDGLELRFGPITKRIPYIEIRSVNRTRNPISSTATSLDRVAIELYSGAMYLVSARENDRLVEELQLRRNKALRGD